MPPTRTNKRNNHIRSVESERKSLESAALAERILSSGFEMTGELRCSSCIRQGRECIVSGLSRRCASCVQLGLGSCDVMGPSAADWARLKREEERLAAEETAAFAEFLRLKALETEALARALRLRKQQASLKTRGLEMMRRGVNSVDALDALEAQERLVSVPFSPEQLASLDPMVDWASVGIVGETPREAVASSPGAS
jgi:hypothetical protein